MLFGASERDINHLITPYEQRRLYERICLLVLCVEYPLVMRGSALFFLLTAVVTSLANEFPLSAFRNGGEPHVNAHNRGAWLIIVNRGFFLLNTTMKGVWYCCGESV